MRIKRLCNESNFNTLSNPAVINGSKGPVPTVVLEEVPLGSGGAAVPPPSSQSQDPVVKSQPAPEAPVVKRDPAPDVPVVKRIMEVKDDRVQETLEDRDPNSLNQHVQAEQRKALQIYYCECKGHRIVWDDIIGEPEGARSPECAWRLSNVCFSHARNWCYTVLAVILAPPCALLLGCGFACLAFEQIWCTGPCLRCAKIYFASLRTMVQSCMAATVVPTAEAVGHLCRHIRVNWRKEAPDERDFLVV